jgi:YfiH family protein
MRRSGNSNATERFLTIPELGRFTFLSHLFGTRWIETPLAVARHLEVSEDRVVRLKQVHGGRVHAVTAENRDQISPPDGHDAVVTDEPDTLLTVATADCVPILIADANRKAVAAVHAGWRGSIQRVAARTVAEMESRFGSKPRDLWVGMGPSAGVCCYEVDGAVLGPLSAGFPDWRSVVRETTPGKAKLDLRGLNALQLAEAGVPREQMRILEFCTVCSGEQFRSYRREGRRPGGMYSGIAIRKP